EVTHANGQVISSQRTQIIQNLEGGILGAVLVGEGEIVEKGTPLAQLDNKLAESQYRDAQNRILENELSIIRLDAELKSESPVFPEDLSAAYPQAIADQMAIFHAREQQQHAEMGLLESQYEQRTREVEELAGRKRQTERSLALAVEQRNIAAPLMQRKAEMEAEINAEISKRRTELNSLKETLAAGGDRVTRTELKSPVRGTVKQIYINTVGGVVKPGEAIMEIVPLDDTLLVEARVRPADVAFLHPGQKAMVKISAYDFSIYGGLEADLEQISADTIEDKRGEFFYLVKVRTHKNAISYRKEQLPIIPGMVTTVDILTGKKTVLDYILKPILKARQNALRER
ncbi:HlyD family type I secretion periplasmic adaptor subunit, partial [uncultured Bilophila sp.]|uniref:HlyD family type I secretion periplasmic adaptor subunit n=1 Tax=uncultured Bilophila sp. TaxID=529385 RepID=UPI00280AD466